MTEIDVPDWVVEVACSAAFVEFSENQRADMRAALTAALGAWVVPVGQAGTMPGTAGFTMAVFKTIDVGVDQPIYTLRQEKPDSENIQHLVDAIANVYRPL